MNELLKNAKELHFEHQKWLSEINEIKFQLYTFSKHNYSYFNKDVSQLLRKAIRLKEVILEHENRISFAFKTCGIYDYSDIFEDHDDIREEMESLKFKMLNLQSLFSKYNHQPHSDSEYIQR